MTRSLAASAFLLCATPAFAQSPDLPSMWNCVAETKAVCFGGECEPVRTVAHYEIDFLLWSYARCTEDACYGGQFYNDWGAVEGQLVVTSLYLTSAISISPDNRFVETFSDGTKAFATEGACKPDGAKWASYTGTMLETWAAFDAWQKAANASPLPASPEHGPWDDAPIVRSPGT